MAIWISTSVLLPRIVLLPLCCVSVTSSGDSSNTTAVYRIIRRGGRLDCSIIRNNLRIIARTQRHKKLSVASIHCVHHHSLQDFRQTYLEAHTCSAMSRTIFVHNKSSHDQTFEVHGWNNNQNLTVKAGSIANIYAPDYTSGAIIALHDGHEGEQAEITKDGSGGGS